MAELSQKALRQEERRSGEDHAVFLPAAGSYRCLCCSGMLTADLCRLLAPLT